MAPDARAFFLRCGFAHRIKVLSKVHEKNARADKPTAKAVSVKDKKKSVRRHMAGVREGAHRGPEKAGRSELGSKLPITPGP